VVGRGGIFSSQSAGGGSRGAAAENSVPLCASPSIPTWRVHIGQDTDGRHDSEAKTAGFREDEPGIGELSPPFTRDPFKIRPVLQLRQRVGSCAAECGI